MLAGVRHSLHLYMRVLLVCVYSSADLANDDKYDFVRCLQVVFDTAILITICKTGLVCLSNDESIASLSSMCVGTKLQSNLPARTANRADVR